MDEFLFAEELRLHRHVAEKTEYLEILNYSEPSASRVDQAALSADDFSNFLRRKGVFAPPSPGYKVSFRNGIRLLLQPDARDVATFAPDVIPFEADRYASVVKEMKLPHRWLETTSAVGPFFWWSIEETPSDTLLQIIFRKSDVQWTSSARGWEMALSFSFRTNITSGFVKGTQSAEGRTLIRHLTACATPAAHPLLMPVLILRSVLSARNDEHQRGLREKLRDLENALSQRYKDRRAIKGPADVGAGAADANLLELDAINRDLTDCHCQVLWKRSQAWQTAVAGLAQATAGFWGRLGEEERAQFAQLQNTLLGRLEFFKVKLDGMESYTHVSLERLNLQREVMHSILDQRESRLSLELAVQQQQLADSTRRDGFSMKTLALLGSFFLPGTFLSSIFSTSFFDFGSDMDGAVSRKLWIYFVIMLPLTGLVVGAWFAFDKASQLDIDEQTDEKEHRLMQLETRITERIRKKTGARVMTGDVSAVEAQMFTPQRRMWS